MAIIRFLLKIPAILLMLICRIITVVIDLAAKVSCLILGPITFFILGCAIYTICKMAAANNQKYLFIFVHEDGAGLEKISEIFMDSHIEASVDEVFDLDDVNKALKKVASGGSRGKTVLKLV